MLSDAEQATLRAIYPRLSSFEGSRIMALSSLSKFIDQLKTSGIMGDASGGTVFINLSAKTFMMNEVIHEIFGLDADHNVGIVEYTKWDQDYAALFEGKTRLPAKYPLIQIKKMAAEVISINSERKDDANPIVTVFNYKGLIFLSFGWGN